MVESRFEFIERATENFCYVLAAEVVKEAVVTVHGVFLWDKKQKNLPDLSGRLSKTPNIRNAKNRTLCQARRHQRLLFFTFFIAVKIDKALFIGKGFSKFASQKEGFL
jgi:hypothetical protein